MSWLLSGIQQVGIGVLNAETSWKWYRTHFGMNVPVFKDAAKAGLMTRYTGGKVEDRYAILAMNLQGGGGMEIWQYTSKAPVKSAFVPALGDTGIFAVKMKTARIQHAFEYFRSMGHTVSSKVSQTPDGAGTFFVKDPDGNLFQVIESNDWFRLNGVLMGGVCGVVIGVSDMEQSIELYKTILGATTVVYDVTAGTEDLDELKSGGGEVRRVLITSRNSQGQGAFGRLLGLAHVELVQVKGRTPRKIFENRNWGDLGFIHVCFDIRGMRDLGKSVGNTGHRFTVDSSDTFDMGKAAGHFTYVEDRDGTLIEFVETHKVPILPRLGIYLNLKKRDPKKPLPNWMVGLLGLNKVTD